MLPVKNTAHVAEGLALLTEQFKGKPVIEGILKAWLAQVQSAEDVTFEVIQSRNLQGVGVQLDILGSLVGETRQGRTDAEYAPAIGLRIQVNQSDGSTRAILDIIKNFLGLYGLSDSTVVYSESQPARFRVETTTLTTVRAAALLRILLQAKPAGVALEFIGNGDPAPGSTGNEIIYDHVTSLPTVPRGFAHTTGLPDNVASSVLVY